MKLARQVIEEAQRLYDLENPRCARDTCHRRVRELVKSCGMELVRSNRWGEAFRLIAAVPIHPDLLDAELFRLRTALIVREQRRVGQARRTLLAILIAVLCYLFFVSPTVFVRLENPYRVTRGLSELDWSEGLYWSVLTSTTVGYGDIVPFTPFGRMFALFNALLGVLLMGVTAGLILAMLTPRRLD